MPPCDALERSVTALSERAAGARNHCAPVARSDCQFTVAQRRRWPAICERSYHRKAELTERSADDV